MGEHVRLESIGVVEEDGGGIVRADGAADFAAQPVGSRFDGLDAAAQPADEADDGEAEGDRLGMLTVRTPHLYLIGLPAGQGDERLLQRAQLGDDALVGSLLEPPGDGGIDHVEAGHAQVACKVLASSETASRRQ